jgi:hypothetical protein
MCPSGSVRFGLNHGYNPDTQSFSRLFVYLRASLLAEGFADLGGGFGIGLDTVNVVEREGEEDGEEESGTDHNNCILSSAL